ncbi:uncharacterized protein LOC128726683 [Anopheles nili]|uniref:uncharacterized protein LOC128726683 n=1 Tax=Anopheles nili TaxID=185578 RepID=UPI00237AB1D1|nr:uncharacterized protein LOC128726683 [Anopheles nili]
MLKFIILACSVGFVLAYDFKDPFFNEILLENLLDDSESLPLSGRFPRSAVDVLDKRCKRRYPCCIVSNDAVLDTMIDIKMDCFREIRAKNRVGKAAAEPINVFNYEGLNKTKEELICAMECAGLRYNFHNEEGGANLHLFLDFAKSIMASQPEISLKDQQEIMGHIQSCIKEAQEKVSLNPPMPGQCSPFASDFGYCIWRRETIHCPKKHRVENHRCDRIREKLTKGEPLHYYKAEIEDI